MIDQQILIYSLTSACLIIGGSLIGVLAWFAIRIIDKIEKLQQDVPGAIAALQNLVVGEIHKLDLRLTRLEAWKDGRESRKSEASLGD